jgi:SNF family Na+-dependent transporter
MDNYGTYLGAEANIRDDAAWTVLGDTTAGLLAGLAIFPAGFVDTFGWTRRRAVWTVDAGSLVLAVPPMIDLRIFVPRDLRFGSGGQTFGALVAVVTIGWVMNRATLLEEIAGPDPSAADRALIHWLRWVVPTAVTAAAVWWLVTDILGIVGSV